MLKKFLVYYKPHKKIFILDMIASFVIALIGMGYPIITRTMLADWIPNKQINLVIIGSCSVLAIYIVRALLRFFVQYYGHVMGVRMQADMRRDLFSKLQKLPYEYYDQHEIGTVLSTMTNDLFDISELAHHGPENILVAGCTVIGSIVYLICVNWILGLVLLGIVPILFFVTWHFRKKFRISMRKTRKSVAKINVRIENSISGIRVTKAYTNEALEKAKFESCNQEHINVRSEVFSAMGQFFSISQFITDFFNILVLLLGGILLYYNFNQFDVADFSAFIISVSLFINPINTLMNFLEQLESASSGFERFITIMEEEEETIHSGKEILTNVKGDITFEDVSFSYDTSEEVLNHVSFTLEAGKTLALVGPSGGGKTTICHLIPRFYFIKEGNGKILLDGKDTSNYTLESLRKNIGIVQQDVFLFGGTIKENILYGKPDASDEELEMAARRANIYDYIMKLPNKWDTDIGERGARLSGGQKQRISIARIFLKNPPLLILDEATSALDNATELMIQESLSELAKGRTCIIVAHRLSTIKHADVIAVVNRGEIQEMGTHKELMKLDGKYRILYELQFRVNEMGIK